MTLSAHISRLRLAHKISFGDGGVKALTLAVRAHGNCVEQSLIFIVLLYFVETYGRIDARVVLVLGAAFVLLRVLYSVSLFIRALRVRQLAHALTVLLQLAAVALLLGA